MIRVVLVDDQMLIRSGIGSLLALTDDIRVVAEAADGASAVAVIARFQPDVLLLDVRMPLCSGIELMRTQQGKLPPTILLTTFDDDGALFDGMRAGAKGFLLKDISPERLADAVRAVAAGGSVFGAAPAPAGSDERVAAQASAGLTSREAEILALMADGANNVEIGAALGFTEGTIKNHVTGIMVKLGVQDRVRAVLRGLERGLI